MDLGRPYFQSNSYAHADFLCLFDHSFDVGSSPVTLVNWPQQPAIRSAAPLQDFSALPTPFTGEDVPLELHSTRNAQILNCNEPSTGKFHCHMFDAKISITCFYSSADLSWLKLTASPIISLALAAHLLSLCLLSAPAQGRNRLDIVVFAKATNSWWLAVTWSNTKILLKSRCEEHHFAAPGYLGFTLHRSISNLIRLTAKLRPNLQHVPRGMSNKTWHYDVLCRV